MTLQARIAKGCSKKDKKNKKNGWNAVKELLLGEL